MSDLRTPIAKVRGLGSAKTGTDHFWIQRVTAIALIPLAVWFIGAVIANLGASHGEAVAFIGHPAVAIPMILFLIAGFWHLKLGLQVVVEDYVSGHAAKLALLLLNVFFCFGAGAASVFAVLKLAFAV